MLVKTKAVKGTKVVEVLPMVSFEVIIELRLPMVLCVCTLLRNVRLRLDGLMKCFDDSKKKVKS